MLQIRPKEPLVTFPAHVLHATAPCYNGGDWSASYDEEEPMSRPDYPRSERWPFMWLIFGYAVWLLMWLVPTGATVALLFMTVDALRRTLWLKLGVYLALAFIFATGIWQMYRRQNIVTPLHHQPDNHSNDF